VEHWIFGTGIDRSLESWTERLKGGRTSILQYFDNKSSQSLHERKGTGQISPTHGAGNLQGLNLEHVIVRVGQFDGKIRNIRDLEVF
jgi:hypothetical protein